MLTPHRRRQILSLALPIIGGMVSQNILNMVDTFMVGQLGDAALAAVGLGSFANFMLVSLVTGMSSGVQATAARRLGQGRTSETAVALNGGLVLSLVVGVPLAVVGFIYAGPIFELLVDDPAVVSDGVPYLRMRLLAVVAVGFNMSFRGYWNAVYLSRLYLRTLLVMHGANVVFNYALIFGKLGAPEMGAMGAGLGTTLATVLGTVYYFLLGTRHARGAGFLRAVPSLLTLRTVFRVSVPASLQSLFFATGMTTLLWIVGRIGTAELAATNVLIQFLLVAVLPGLAFGLAAATFVGEALGKRQVEDAREWGRDVARMAALVVGGLTVPGLIFPTVFLAPFLRDPATLQLAVLPLQLAAIAMSVDAVGMVLMQAHLGAGASRRSMMVSVGTQWLLGLPAAYVLGPVMGFGLVGAWIGHIGYRIVQTVIFLLLWQGDGWTRVKL
jgi:putative MATE family efflux protein